MAHNNITGAIFDIFGDIGRARSAQNLYTQLSSMSDTSLAKRGLKRADIARYAFDTSFADK